MAIEWKKFRKSSLTEERLIELTPFDKFGPQLRLTKESLCLCFLLKLSKIFRIRLSDQECSESLRAARKLGRRAEIVLREL